MDDRDRQAIEGLFVRLGDVERQGAERDGEAEAFIAERLREQPAAPYYMAQTIVVQEQALEAAQARITELEERSAGAGGLLGGLFGGGARSSRGSVPSVGARPRHGGSGFLAGAVQTALGVTGGVVLGSMLAGAIAGDEAAAGEAAAEPGPQDDAGGGDFGGGDFDLGGL